MRATPRIRPYHESDLGGVVSLCERSGLLWESPDGLTIEETTGLLAASGTQALVAEEDGTLVGLVLVGTAGPLATLFRIVGEPGIRARLLTDLESRLRNQGVTRLMALIGDATERREELEEHGYRRLEDSVLLERHLEGARPDTAASELGGRMIEPDLWDRLEGMEQVKQIIERRIILPLGERDLAARHGVDPPHAVVLFGPPGTGKTTFAKGIASKLSWPFVPVEPAQLSGEEGAAEHLADLFERILALPAAVAFVDEVEDLASTREDERRVSRRVTNEFLRRIPSFRDSTHHLLVCATNRVGRLDPAFLRPGRFDHVLPVGPPDAAAREAIWRRYVGEITDEDVDVERLVGASERFTPADIEFAARKAAQFAFEREYFGDAEHRATTDDFLRAIEATRPTLTDEMIASFEEDRERSARF